jgi:serine/threonine protein kinase
MAPEILLESKQRHVSPKCDVYSFGVLLIELVNGSRFTLDRCEFRKFIQWERKMHVEEDGFQQIFNVIIKNSIVGFNNNEAKLFLQFSLKCMQVIFPPIFYVYHSICGQVNFKNLKSWVNGIFKTI